MNLVVQYDIVKLLVDRGANVNAAGSNGVTPLMLAVGAGQVQTVHLLIAKGANVNAVDRHKQSLLKWALINGNPEIVQMLRQAHATE